MSFPFPTASTAPTGSSASLLPVQPATRSPVRKAQCEAETAPAISDWQARLSPGARSTLLHIPTGSATPLGLAPGQWLMVIDGCVALESGPQVWGQVLVQARRRLDTGDVIEGGEDGLPTWLRLSCERGPAHVAVIEPARTPSLLASLIRSLVDWLTSRRQA